MINKLFVIILAGLSTFIFLTTTTTAPYLGFFFLPIPAYFLAELFTNSDDFQLTTHKKTALVYLGILVILILYTLTKII